MVWQPNAWGIQALGTSGTPTNNLTHIQIYKTPIQTVSNVYYDSRKYNHNRNIIDDIVNQQEN